MKEIYVCKSFVWYADENEIELNPFKNLLKKIILI